MATDADTEVTAEDVIPLPPSEEGFEADAVPVLLELVTERLRGYVQEQMSSDQPISLLGFALELVYKTGYDDGRNRRR